MSHIIQVTVARHPSHTVRRIDGDEDTILDALEAIDLSHNKTVELALHAGRLIAAKVDDLQGGFKQWHRERIAPGEHGYSYGYCMRLADLWRNRNHSLVKAATSIGAAMKALPKVKGGPEHAAKTDPAYKLVRAWQKATAQQRDALLAYLQNESLVGKATRFDADGATELVEVSPGHWVRQPAGDMACHQEIEAPVARIVSAHAIDPNATPWASALPPDGRAYTPDQDLDVSATAH